MAYSWHEYSSPAQGLQEPSFPRTDHQIWVWLDYSFCLSYRDVEELLFVRGITVTYEAVRQWSREFGQQYADQLWHRRPEPGETRHLDEVLLIINGDRRYLWPAVDQEGNVSDRLVQRRRAKVAAKKFFHKLLKCWQYVLRVTVTDKLRSYSAAEQKILPGVGHRQRR